jgi:hypothetical protein
MSKRIVLAALCLGAVLFLAGCDTGLSGGVTISGTVSGSYFDISNNPTISVSSGSMTASETIPLDFVGSYQSGLYSISHVPAGTYTVTISFENPWPYTGNSTYNIAGGAQGVPANSNTYSGSAAPYLHTIIFDNVPVNANETIDVDLGNIG